MKPALGFITAVQRRAFLSRILSQNDFVPLRDKRVIGDVVPDDFFAKNGGFGEVFRLDALGDFLFPVEFGMQLALVLFRAPNGLDRVVVGLRDPAMAAL